MTSMTNSIKGAARMGGLYYLINIVLVFLAFGYILPGLAELTFCIWLLAVGMNVKNRETKANALPVKGVQ
jgi:hypothetical protein